MLYTVARGETYLHRDQNEVVHHLQNFSISIQSIHINNDTNHDANLRYFLHFSSCWQDAACRGLL